jgi:hypothetical protein
MVGVDNKVRYPIGSLQFHRRKHMTASARPESTRDFTLLLLMLLYGAVSLLHFSHNAIHLHEYPRLPLWLTSAGVWVSWCGVAALGVLGYWLYRRISRWAGVTVIAVYGALGFAALDHYAVAPMGAHSFVMNLTILCEVAAAAALLLFLVWSARVTSGPSSPVR